MKTLQALLLRFPLIHNLLWKGNCFHGMALMGYSVSKNCLSADCSDALLLLQKLNYISHGKFRPTHSQAAFMGLEKGVHKNDHLNPPNPGNASAFDWFVNKDLRMDI